MSLKLVIDGESFTADWIEESEARSEIRDALPFSGSATRWGKEIYFEIPVDADPEDTEKDVEVGDVAYWPRGNSLCIFWGETPASIDEGEPRAASGVKVVAELHDPEKIDDIKDGAKIEVTEL